MLTVGLQLSIMTSNLFILAGSLCKIQKGLTLI